MLTVDAEGDAGSGAKRLAGSRIEQATSVGLRTIAGTPGGLMVKGVEDLDLGKVFVCRPVSSGTVG